MRSSMTSVDIEGVKGRIVVEFMGILVHSFRLPQHTVTWHATQEVGRWWLVVLEGRPIKPCSRARIRNRVVSAVPMLCDRPRTQHCCPISRSIVALDPKIVCPWTKQPDSTEPSKPRCPRPRHASEEPVLSGDERGEATFVRPVYLTSRDAWR